MDIKQLKCFVAAVEVGNFTRASEQLHIAQSAFSRHINNLETELGVQLFIRKGRGVEVSPEGFGAYERARKLLIEFGSFRRDVASKKAETSIRKITLAAHGGVGPLFLPNVARRIKFLNDNVQFRLDEGLSEQIERDVTSGDCDIGIVIRRNGFKVERADLESIRLVDDELVAVGMTEDGSLLGKDWSAKDVFKQPLVMPPSGSLERTSYENWGHSHDMALKIVGEANAVSTRIELARKIGAVCILPSMALADLLYGNNWQIHKIAKDEYYQSIDWFIIFRRTVGDRLVRTIVDVIQEQATSLLERRTASLNYTL